MPTKDLWPLAVLLSVAGCGVYADPPGTPRSLVSVRATHLANGELGLCLGLTDKTVRCLNTQSGTNELGPVRGPMGSRFVPESIFYGTNYCMLFDDLTMDCPPNGWTRTDVVSAAFAGGGIFYVTSSGELRGATDTSGTTVTFPLDGLTAREVVSTDGELCAILSDATVRCWPVMRDWGPGAGKSTFVIGAGKTVEGLKGVTLLVMKVHDGATQTNALLKTTRCAVAEGKVKCWGYNEYGQVGTGVEGQPVAVPTEVTLPEVVQVDLANGRGCALTKTGDVYCWGHSVDQPDDVRVRRTSLTNVTQLSLGLGMDAALRKDGVIVLWGGSHRVGPEWNFVPLALGP